MSIADKLRKLLDIKGAIKEALFYVGQEVADKMEDWAMAIREVCNVPFENLGYTEEQARHCRWIIRNAYQNGIKQKEGLPLIANLPSFKYANLKEYSSYKTQTAITFLVANNIEQSYISYRDSDFSFTNITYADVNFKEGYVPSGTLGFANSPSLIYIKIDVSSFGNLSYFCRNLSIGTSNCVRVIKLQGLGTHPDSNSVDWHHNIYLGIPFDTDEENLTTNARQDLVDTLLTNSFDRASAGYSVFTITLAQATFDLLTEEEITAITAKGYTITVA